MKKPTVPLPQGVGRYPCIGSCKKQLSIRKNKETTHFNLKWRGLYPGMNSFEFSEGFSIQMSLFRGEFFIRLRYFPVNSISAYGPLSINGGIPPPGQSHVAFEVFEKGPTFTWDCPVPTSADSLHILNIVLLNLLRISEI